MAEQAGFEIRADLKALRAELAEARNEFRTFNDAVIKAASGVKPLEDAGNRGAKSFNLLGTAARAASFALGVLGVNSVIGITNKLVGFVKESLNASVALQAVENRAKAIFGDSFPKITAATQRMAEQFKRSTSDLLDFATGFAELLDSAGASSAQVNKYSIELTKLAVAIGKARPELSDADVYSRIQAGILGNVRGLRELGIVMNNKALQDFADHKNIRLKIQDMTDEQLIVLRSQFLLEQTTKLQDAAARSAGQLGDTTKTVAAAWKDLEEGFGTDISPMINKWISVLLQGLKAAYDGIQRVSAQWLSLNQAIGRASGVGGGVAKDSLTGFAVTTYGRAGFNARNAAVDARFGPAVENFLPTPESPLPDDTNAGFWRRSGSSAADANKRQEAETKLIEALKQEASAGEDNLKTRREELQLRKDLGLLTKAERAELDSINKRLLFQKNVVEEATKAWEDQKQKVKEVNDHIADLNDRAIEEKKRLKQTLAEIDRDAAKEKQQTAEELIRKRNELQAKMTANGGAGLTGEESYQYGQLLDQIKGFDANTVSAASADASLSPAQKIDAEALKKKKEAAVESNARLQSLIDELTQAQINKQQIVDLENQKRQAVIAALDQRVAKTTEAYAAIESSTAAHVEKMRQLYSQLAASTAAPAVPAQRRAFGGPIFGSGGPTDDKVPAWLSNGEYVINAAATRMYLPLIQAINTMSLPRFANGGEVSSVDNSDRRIVNIKQTFNRSELSNPLLHRWHMRFALT